MQGDAALDPTGTGTKILPFTRSESVRSDDGLDTREAVDINTHFLDASMVRWYSTVVLMTHGQSLRTHRGSELCSFLSYT